MLQNEKTKFRDFGYYAEWVAKVKTDPVMQWLNDERVGIVHQRALEPKSWLEMRCIDNPRMAAVDEDDDDVSHPFRFHANPFMCTHHYMNGPRTDHAHEFGENWSTESEGFTTAGREAAGCCRAAAPPRPLRFACLDDRVATQARMNDAGDTVAHRIRPSGGASRRLPCMENTLPNRVIRTVIRDGREIWQDEPAGLHHP